MLFVGCGLGWLVAERLESSRGRNAVRLLQELNSGFGEAPRLPEQRPAWIRFLAGENPAVVFLEGGLHGDISGHEEAIFRPLKNLRAITYFGSPITVNGMHEIARLKNLREVEINNAKVSEEALAALGEARQLEKLSFWFKVTGITDAGVCISSYRF